MRTSIRPLALMRKNALFAGHDLGAESRAMIASLIEMCKLERSRSACVDDRSAGQARRWPASKIDELMPWAYAKPA
jgi:transposase